MASRAAWRLGAGRGNYFGDKQWGEYVAGYRQRNGWWFYDNGTWTLDVSHDWGDGYGSLRVGKKAAGRLLSGVEWNERP